MASNTSAALCATYESPTNESFTIEKTIAPPSATTPVEKTAYLQKLREAVTTTQDQINKELTLRMEEDKTRAGGQNDDVKEEEKYGEEEQEEA